MEVIRSFEAASGKTINYKVVPRREGELAAYWVDPSLAQRELAWKVTRGLDAMMRDTWNWQKVNPNGYNGECRAK